MNRTDRLLATLLAFQARRQLRADDLAARFEVSVRTVYRDIQALSEAGVPIAAMPGTGYRLLEGYFLPPVSFTADEAAVLTLGGQFVRDQVDPALSRVAEEALLKLLAILPADRRQVVERWQEDVHFVTFRDTPDPRTMSALRIAIQQHRVARLLYHARGRSSPEWRDVEPVSLVHADTAWCLASFCRLRQARRVFRLDRIDHIELLPEYFTPAPRHLLGPECGEPLDRHPKAQVRFDPVVERWVRERQPFTFLYEETGDAGPTFVYALRDDGAGLLSWLLSWGGSVEILDPPWLQERFAIEARAMLVRHIPVDDRTVVTQGSDGERDS